MSREELGCPISLVNVYFKDYLKDINICFEERLVHCIVGPNGSGKTTLLRLIVGLMKPSKGSISVFGFNPFYYRGKFHKKLAASLEPQPLPSSVTLYEYLKHVASLYGIDLKNLLELVDKLNLTKYKNFFINTLSSGNVKKLLLIQSIGINPDVLILDEPTMNLDIHARRVVLEHLENLKRKGTTIIISSHEFHDIEKIADKIYFMFNGRIISSGFLNMFLEKYAVSFSKNRPDLPNEQIYLTVYGDHFKIVGERDTLEKHGFDIKPPSLTDIYEYMLYQVVTYEGFRTV